MQKKRAFTLLELSVVVVVIGILIVGVMQGANLVNSARLANARSLTARSPVPGIAGLMAWYETSLRDSFNVDEAVSNGLVSVWYDSNPDSVPQKKNRLTRVANADVLFKPEGINKLPALSFNGSGSFNLANFAQGGSAQYTVFLVFKPSAFGSTIFDSDSANANSISLSADVVTLNVNGSSEGTDTSSLFTVSSDYIAAIYFNNASSGVYINDFQNLAGDANLTSIGASQLYGLSIGLDKDGANGFNGLISEVIIYNRPLKPDERKDVMSYLSKKYQITVNGL
jgi:prepilin-type N-terminal cleavage/methylation domain-containing protein